MLHAGVKSVLDFMQRGLSRRCSWEWLWVGSRCGARSSDKDDVSELGAALRCTLHRGTVCLPYPPRYSKQFKGSPLLRSIHNADSNNESHSRRYLQRVIPCLDRQPSMPRH